MTREDIARAIFQDAGPSHSWEIQAQPAIIGRMSPDDIWRQALSEAEAKAKYLESGGSVWLPEKKAFGPDTSITPDMVSNAQNRAYDLLMTGLFGKDRALNISGGSSKYVGKGIMAIPDGYGGFRYEQVPGWSGQANYQWKSDDKGNSYIFNPSDGKYTLAIHGTKPQRMNEVDKVQIGTLEDQNKSLLKLAEATIQKDVLQQYHDTVKANLVKMEEIMQKYQAPTNALPMPIGGTNLFPSVGSTNAPANVLSNAPSNVLSNAPISTNMVQNLPQPAEPTVTLPKRRYNIQTGQFY